MPCGLSLLASPHGVIKPRAHNVLCAQGCAWLGALITDPKVLKSKRVVSSQVTKDECKSST